ncbi:hypothetical protein CPC16_001738 [Podila verticillata]|nr:hypothetical protein CPC16_001738 [Podila verticillata]
MPIDFTHWPSKVANIIVYVALLSGNLYSTFGSDKDAESPYHSQHQSYITPAPYTFYMWTVIHFLLGGMVVYQWFTDKVHQATSWHFCVASIMNAAWLALWSTGHTFFALIPLFFATGAVSFIYYRLKEDHTADTLLDVVFLHLPFSLYHGWVFVLMIINVFAVLSPVRDNGPSTFQVILAVAGLCFVSSTVIGYIEYKQGDVAGALVLAWFLFGVFDQQRESAAIHWTALGLGIGVAAYTLKPFVFRLRACQVNVSHAFADKYQLLSAHYFTLLDTRIQASFLYGLPPTPTLMTQQQADRTLSRLSSAVTRAKNSWDLSLFRTIFDTIFVDEPKFKGDCNEPHRVVQPPLGVNWTMSDCHSMDYICGNPPSICHFMPMIKTRIVRKLKEQLAGKLNGGQDADVYVNFLGPALQTILQSQPTLREYTARLHGNLNEILEGIKADVEAGFAEEDREWDLEIKTLLLSYP